MKLSNNIPDKREDKNTTSLKFKQDLIEFFEQEELSTCLEVGTSRGWTTLVLSNLFEEVHTMEISLDLISQAKENTSERTNITFHNKDVTEDWNLPLTNFDVIFIDCIHSYEAVVSDIIKSVSYSPSYLVFDDYGLPHLPGVRKAIREFLKVNPHLECTYIGEPKGNEPRRGKPLVDWEGVIIKL